MDKLELRVAHESRKQKHPCTIFGTGWADNLCDLIGSKTGNLTQEISPPSIKRPAKKPSTYGLI